jgi:hypothetical protein
MWKEFGDKWYYLCAANAEALEGITVFKKSYKGNMYSKVLNPGDWKSKAGYNCKVISKGEKEQDALDNRGCKTDCVNEVLRQESRRIYGNRSEVD